MNDKKDEKLETAQRLGRMTDHPKDDDYASDPADDAGRGDTAQAGEAQPEVPPVNPGATTQGPA